MSERGAEFGVVGHHWQAMRRRRPGAVALALAVCLFPGGLRAFGQRPARATEPEAFLNRQRTVDEQLRQQYDKELGEAQRALFDWGGWYNSYLFIFDDGVESSRTFRENDMRLWGRVSIDGGAHEFYARTRLSLLDFNSGDAYDGNENDVEGPNLERGFYKFDLARAMQAYENRRIDYNLSVSAGRDLVQFGNGVALAIPLDHVALRSTYRGWESTALVGKTVGSTQDFDLSRTAERTRRNFIGGQVRYLGWDRHEPFAYGFWQRDKNEEAIYRLGQDFDYDSFYFGVGAIGELAPRWRYGTEWVYETGNSHGQRRLNHSNDIHAWAVQGELEYLFPGKRQARASIEYLFGSGDGDRIASPTNTVGGNVGDSEDSSFIGFGYQDTGLSFAPRYSNLHMWRTGASMYPWPDHSKLRQLELGSDLYLYYKHHASGAVSDPTAVNQSGYLGFEMDYFANWRVTADLAWTARFGFFLPGDAFDDRSPRTFFMVGMNRSF